MSVLSSCNLLFHIKINFYNVKDSQAPSERHTILTLIILSNKLTITSEQQQPANFKNTQSFLLLSLCALLDLNSCDIIS